MKKRKPPRRSKQTDLYSLIEKQSASEEALRETISFLIHHRELMRDLEIEELVSNVEELEDRIADQKRNIMIEELRCFKEVMELHRRLLKKNDR